MIRFCKYFKIFLIQWIFNLGVFYNVLIYMAAYILLLVLGWKIHRYTVANLQLIGVSIQERRRAVLNRQLNRVLIIQVNINVPR